MLYRPLVLYLILSVLLLPIAAGCQIFRQNRPVSIQALDADTKQPISGATVALSYPLADSYLAPSTASATTNENGLALVSTAPYGDSSLLLTVTANGYFTESQSVPVQTVQNIEPDHLFQTVKRHSPNLIVELYATEPNPSIELVVPTGYRGPIQAEIRIAADAPSPPGQRSFSYVVPASGSVLIEGPAILRHFPLPDFTAKYADGTPLPRKAQGSEIGFWWLKTVENSYSFLVGTASEAALSRPESPESVGKLSSGSGKGQGRGRRNRMGNSSSTDPSTGGLSPP